MSNNLELLPGGGGADLTTREQADTAHVQVIQPSFGPDSADVVPVTKAAPLPVDPQSITAAQRNHATSAALAPGASVDLDSSQVSSGTTGKLMGLWVGATAPLKVEVKTVLNAAESVVLATAFSSAGQMAKLPLPSKDHITQAHSVTAGFDGFRVTITNLDTGAAGVDVYATFFWDEA